MVPLSTLPMIMTWSKKRNRKGKAWALVKLVKILDNQHIDMVDLRGWFWTIWKRFGQGTKRIWAMRIATMSSWYWRGHRAWMTKEALYCWQRRPHVWAWRRSWRPKQPRNGWKRHKRPHWETFHWGLGVWGWISWSWWVLAYIPMSNRKFASRKSREWIWR